MTILFLGLGLRLGENEGCGLFSLLFSQVLSYNLFLGELVQVVSYLFSEVQSESWACSFCPRGAVVRWVNKYPQVLYTQIVSAVSLEADSQRVIPMQ